MQAQSIEFNPVLIVEDDAATRTRLLRLMRDLAGAAARIDAVAGMVEAREHLQRQPCALALVDVNLPDGNGIDLVAWITRRLDGPSSVIVSAFAAEDTILAAVRAGAIGYLLKDRDDEELKSSLESLRRGGAPIDPLIARRILALVPPAPMDATPSPESAPPLSGREHEILRLVARGFSNREIADLLALSRLTIECHTKNIYRKLSVGSRTSAVFEARALGLLD
ncbi:response regulator transcription factor [Marilutibacter spongiae]|uniref:Response regulator transcription factor n=1 Tax=Marilutibacter spongiae TaxID=2025720 RepID=A0A7W3TMZ5_9GAMM|nr:response regulator transcription factor [Lysobacter spongiae]MBB1061302.1 response regulator transcription factor [Lysobacter spongiae]